MKKYLDSIMPENLNPWERDALRDQVNVLNFYWDRLYQQLKKGSFQYRLFQELLKDTLEYLLPRVGKEQVYRKDLELIGNIGALGRVERKEWHGCTPWEFDAAQKFSEGLMEAIINRYGDNDEFPGGCVLIDVLIEDKPNPIEGVTCIDIKLSGDNLFYKMDEIAEVIHKVTYEGDDDALWKLINEEP